MKNIKDVMHDLTDAKTVTQALTDTLRTLDPEFPEEESRFLAACEALEDVLGDAAGEYLTAREAAFAGELVYFGWQGFRLNLDIFREPVNALLLQGDWELMCRERSLGAIPAVRKARDVTEAFYARLREQPERIRALTGDITAYYSYLETVGHKLAHYFGFRLAEKFLPNVIPGYIGAGTVTHQYAAELKQFLQLDLDSLD